MSYRWDDDKDEPVKEDDHAMDALRYAVYTNEKKTDVKVEAIKNPFA
jgi:phage terminase large subunit